MDEIGKGVKVRHKLFGTVGRVEKIDGPWITLAFEYPEPDASGKRTVARRVRVNKYILQEKYEVVE